MTARFHAQEGRALTPHSVVDRKTSDTVAYCNDARWAEMIADGLNMIVDQVTPWSPNTRNRKRSGGMTNRSPVCDGCKDPVPAGQSYATIITPGTHDRHLCTRCAHLVWRYLPDLIRHRDLTAQAVSLAVPIGDVRERALRMDLPFRRKSPLRP